MLLLQINILFRSFYSNGSPLKIRCSELFDDYFELNACYYRYYMKLPVLGEGDYGAFRSILPLSCLAAGAEQRLGFCLSIRLHRGGYHTHTSRYT